MKKNEYVSPEVEIVEITEKFDLMGTSGGDLNGEIGSGDDADLDGF